MEIPENYGQATFIYEFIDTGEKMTTSVGFENTALQDAITLANSISTVWAGEFTPSTTLDSYRYNGCYVIIGIGGVLQSAQSIDDADGTVNAAPVSPAVSIGVKKQTSYAGKKYRGRMYLSPAHLSEANVNGAGVIDGATVSALQGLLDNFYSGMIANDTPCVLLHSDATTPTPINAFLVRDNVRTQRRRQHLR